MKPRYALSLLSLAVAAGLHAQDVQKCCNNSNSTFLLGNTNYARHTQCLYTPADLTGEAVGYITTLYYRYGNTGAAAGNTLGSFRVAFAQTSSTTFADTVFYTDLDVALETASFTIPAGTEGDWFTIELTTPFAYDPTRTLLVDIRFETSENETFGTMSSTANDHKLMSPSTTSAYGEVWTSLQDIGFDLANSIGITTHVILGSTLAPDPATDRTELRLPAPLAATARVVLTDATGRIARTQQALVGTTRVEIDLNGLPTGLYVLQLQDGTGTVLSHRLVKE